MKLKRFFPLVVMLLLATVGVQNARAVDGKKLLQEMATKIARAKRCSVTMYMRYDAVQKSGAKVEFAEQRLITFERPNHFRTDARLSNGDRNLMIFDGKTLNLCSLTSNVYSSTPFIGSVDEAIRFAGGTLGIRIPLARMLVTDFPAQIEKLAQEVYYVERNTLGSTPTDHLFVVAKNVDCQLWIAADKLPRRIVLTYKNEPGQPQFRANFDSWNLNPQIPAQTFVFTPPKGAEKIPMLLPASMLPQKQPQKGDRR